MSDVCTRFAPSPTGYLHIGGARTALFAWAFAQANGGRFILRIEDTDLARSQPQMAQGIIDGLSWLGICPTQADIFYQSQRARLYEEALEKLLSAGSAYYCHCSEERLRTLRERQLAEKQNPKYDGYCRDLALPEWKDGVRGAVRFRTPLDGSIAFEDGVKGLLSNENAQLDDLIIARSDGSATYNFAAAVDDIDMGITHVIRGDDHVNNTHRQIHLFRALGVEPPAFAHLPLILIRAADDDDYVAPVYERLSKRKHNVDLLSYQHFLPDAVKIYLMMLGYAHSGEEERLPDWETLVASFHLSKIRQSPSRFDIDKLRSVNKTTLSEASIDTIREALGVLRGDDLAQVASDIASVSDEVISLVAPRAHDFRELHDGITYFLHPVSIPVDSLRAFGEASLASLAELSLRFQKENQWDNDFIAQSIKEVASDFSIKFPQVAMPLRLALTGRNETPDIAKVTHILGKNTVCERLDHALSLVGNDA